jgi:hypothetical protein
MVSIVGVERRPNADKTNNYMVQKLHSKHNLTEIIITEDEIKIYLFFKDCIRKDQRHVSRL